LDYGAHSNSDDGSVGHCSAAFFSYRGHSLTAFANFISPAFIFVMVMFIIAQAVASAGLDRRFACWLLAHAGTDSRRIVMVLMIGTALLSLVISDVL
jgi:di/tricarboxylate transporter